MSQTATHSRSGEFATSRKGGVDDYEMSQIVSLRLRGVGIQNIANMLGRPASTVAAYLVPVRQATEPRQAAPAPTWRRPSGGVFTPEVRAVLDRIVREETMRAFQPEEAMFSFVGLVSQSPMRQGAYYRASRETDLNRTALGKYFNRSLTSITTGIATHQARMDAAQAKAVAA